MLTELIIYTQSGRLINKINDKASQTNFISIEWDGKDFTSNFVPNGTYLYTLNIILDNESYKNTGVLSIIR